MLAGRFSYGDCFVIMSGCLCVISLVKITTAIALPSFITEIITRGSNGFEVTIIVFVLFGWDNNKLVVTNPTIGVLAKVITKTKKNVRVSCES